MRKIKPVLASLLMVAASFSITGGAANASESDCSASRVCLWGGQNYTYGVKQLTASNPNITDFNDVMSSWKNSITTKDAFWHWDANYVNGGECMNSSSKSAWVGTHNNDELTSVYIYTNTTAC